MYAASREAYAATRATLRSSLDASGADVAPLAAAVGSELFAVVDLLDKQRPLRRALSDPSTDPTGRARLADTIFGGKVSAAALATVSRAVSRQWSSSRDLVDSLERLGRESLLKSAEAQYQLDSVEDELFRFGRIVAANPELEQALSNRNTEPAGKQDLLRRLLYGKVTAVTEALVQQAIGRLRGAPADALEAVSRLAAESRDRAVAVVSSASELSDGQRSRLAQTLERIYGKPVIVHTEVDPGLLSGLLVRIGDEVIDGSGAGRLAQLRRNLR